MSIKINNKDIVAIYKGEQSIAYVYKGIDLVWQLNADPLDKSIYFADPEVGRVLHANGLIANPIKSSKRELATITTLNPNPDAWDGRTTSYFYNNKVITKFPELQYCTGLSDLRHTFYDCSNLREATIPDSVTNMTCTFDGCSSLIIPPVIPEGVTDLEYTFRGCSKLAEAPIIPEGVTELIGTFYGCSSLLKAPIIPEGVTRMSYTFRGCSKLRKAPILPKGVISISEAFYGCSSLTEVPIIPEGVVSMDRTFTSCSSLVYTTPIIIPESVIGMTECFRYCSSLEGIFILKPINPPTYYYSLQYNKSVVAVYVPDESLNRYKITSDWNGVSARIYPMSEIPFEVDGKFDDPEVGRVLKLNGLIANANKSSIEELANITSLSQVFRDNKVITQFPELQYCTGLTNLSYAFRGCSSLTTVVIPEGVTNLYGTFYDCSSLIKAPVIPSSVTTLRETFRGCSSLTIAPDIPSSVTNLDGTFKDCTSLRKAPIIPESVANMEDTFNGCTSLATAPDIPNNVTDLTRTFEGCISIDGIYIINIATPITYDNSLSNVQTIYAPNESVQLYKEASGWSDFADKIYPIGYNPFEVDGKFADPEVGRVLHANGLIADPVKSSIEELATIRSLNPDGYNTTGYFYNNKVITKFPELKYCTRITSLRSAFYGCSNLTTVGDIIPSSVTNMNGTFEGCSSLLEAPVIPSNVTDLSWTFRNCSSLVTAPVIPWRVDNLSYTFNGCSSIDGFYIINVSIPPNYNYSLENVQTIYVRDASVDRYKSKSGWSDFADKIYPMSSKP